MMNISWPFNLQTPKSDLIGFSVNVNSTPPGVCWVPVWRGVSPGMMFVVISPNWRLLLELAFLIFTLNLPGNSLFLL